MSYKLLKEDFVSNLNGTDLLEITIGLALAPLCVLSRGLLLILYFLHYGRPLQSTSRHFLLDFTVLVVPPLLACTVLAPILPLVILGMTAFCAILVAKIYTKRTNYVRLPFGQILSDFLSTNLVSDHIPSVTVFRVYINVLTSICILAVDFPQYPRRYAKTETYGTGVMDFGVGAFIFANAVVCPEVRQKSGTPESHLSHLARQFFAVWPLLLLGFARLLSVKGIEYAEHTSEYGVHWNFFFTLAIVRMAAALLLTVFPVRKAWMVAATLAVIYECLLDLTPLKMFILHGSDGKDSRAGFLNANREGLFSAIGFLALYMASVQVGLYLLKKRGSIKEWIGVIGYIFLIISLLFIFLYVIQTCVETISRRMANLPFCVWILGHCLALFLCILMADLVLVFTKFLVDGVHIPHSWNFAQPSVASKKCDLKSRENKIVPCMIGAVNNNQLLYFMLANVCTGVVNMLVDTIHSNTLFAMFFLHLYMIVNCLVMYILHAKNIILKWW